MNLSNDLSNKVVVVTGAGGGIGKPTALAFAARGACVVAADIDLDAAKATADLIKKTTVDLIKEEGGKAIAVRVDITDEAEVIAMISATEQAFGSVDVLVNNAALGSREDHNIHEMDVALWDRIVAGNTRGTMLCCKHALPAMIARGSGAIVNIASGAALTGQLTLPAYAAAKAGVISLTQSVATMYGKQGIRCNAIAPGLILHERLAPGYPAEHIQMDLNNVLTPHQGTAQDIANAVVFLASDASRFITGHVLPGDGGLLAHTPFYAAIRALSETAS